MEAAVSQNDPQLKDLTRALLLGISLGTVSVTLAGCVPQQSALPVQSEVPEPQLFSQALSSGDPRVVNAYLVTYPGSPRVSTLLSSLPPQTLAGVSRNAVAQLPPQTLNRLPPRVHTQLVPPPVMARTRDGGGEPNRGSERSSS
jgi:hypothetical protein